MMDTIKQIDIEKIMEEIRADIRAKGYVNDIPSFETSLVAVNPSGNFSLNTAELNFEIGLMNQTWNVQAYRPVGKGIKAFIKKVIRKLTKFYVEPIVKDQDDFNAHCVRAMNVLNSISMIEGEFNALRQQMEQQNKVIEQQSKLIGELTSKTEKLEALLAPITDNK